MDYDLLIAGIIGLGPGVALMYWTLRDYTYPKVERPFFDDRKVFLLFAVGLVVGTVLYAIHTWFSFELILVAFGFAMAEVLLKLIVLDLPRFQGKLDTSFYGLSFGLGIGSTIAFGSFYVTANLLGGLTAGTSVVLILMAIQLVLLHASTGATVGIGVARSDPWPYFAQALMIHLAYNLLMIPFFHGEELLAYLLFGLATLILILYYLQVHFRMLPDVVEDHLSRMKSRSKA